MAEDFVYCAVFFGKKEGIAVFSENKENIEKKEAKEEFSIQKISIRIQ